MTPHFLIWSFGPKIGSVDRICHQTDSMDRFYLDVKTGPIIITLGQQYNVGEKPILYTYCCMSQLVFRVPVMYNYTTWYLP